MKFCDTCKSTYPGDFAVCPKDQSPLRVADELAVGMQLRGKYEILEKIGSGGMATVYRAHHLHLKEDLAIKVVGAHLMGDKHFLERFQTEAVITRKLHHPNAVRLDDFDITEDGRPFIVMEFVRGHSLRSTLMRQGYIAVPRALQIARETALALGAAHKLGIVHRDIKPDNVLLVALPDGGEQAKVLDFGIAKVLEGSFDTGSYAPTKTGLVLGTPQYLSPEQAMGKRGNDVDGRSDLYSLGVMLFEMLTGSLPFHSDTPIGLLMQHIQAPTPMVHLIRPELGIPEIVSNFLLKAMAKDRNQRFQTGEEMAEELARILPVAAAASQGEKPVTASFGTAALAAAASMPTATTAAPLTELKPPQTPPVASGPATIPITAEPSHQTKVMGSDTMSAVLPHGDGKLEARKRDRLKYGLIGAGLAVVALIAWLAWPSNKPVVLAPNSDAIPPVESDSQQPSRPHSSSRSGGRSRVYSDPASQPATQEPRTAPRRTEPQGPSAADKTRAQELAARGWQEMSRKNYRNAQYDFEDALKLDPENSSAQKGMQAAQAAQTIEGIGGIFRR